MMSLAPKMRDDEDNDSRRGLVRGVKIVAAGTGIIFCAGAIGGALAAHFDQGGGPLNWKMMGILAAFAGAIIGLAFVIARLIRQHKAEAEPVSSRERLNRQIMIACAVAGGLIGALLSLNVVETGEIDSIFSSAPLLPALAIPLAIFWGLIMPVISYVWHRRAIDEQEAAAYNQGALMAIYVFWYAAPVWWLLWRADLAPAPHGPTIYMATIFTALVVWTWKKYR